MLCRLESMFTLTFNISRDPKKSHVPTQMVGFFFKSEFVEMRGNFGCPGAGAFNDLGVMVLRTA